METRRSPRSKRILILSLASSILVLSWVFLSSELSLKRRYEVPALESPRALASLDQVGPTELSRGRHLATVVAQCQFCHGNDLGGREIADDPALGRIDSSNLTRGQGGVGARYSRSDWENAIRFGVRPDRSSLLLMPSEHLAALSRDDLDAIVDFLLSVPPVDRVPRERSPGWGTRIAVAFGWVDDIFSAGWIEEGSRSAGWEEAVPEEATAAYGAYLVELGNCRVCHRADLRGGLHPLALPGEPDPPPLRGADAMRGWRFQEFASAMREGRTPSGRILDREYMPWPGFAGLSDLELEAMWRFLSTARVAAL